MSGNAARERQFPYIDPSVEYAGVSTLRLLNATKLRKLANPMVISDNGKRLAVLLPYDLYMLMQAAIIKASEAAPERAGEAG